METEKWHLMLAQIKRKGSRKKRVHKLLAIGMSLIVLALGATQFYHSQNQWQQKPEKKILLSAEEENVRFLMTVSGYYYNEELGVVY